MDLQDVFSHTRREELVSTLKDQYMIIYSALIIKVTKQIYKLEKKKEVN